MIQITIDTGHKLALDVPEYVNHDYYIRIEEGEITDMLMEGDIDYLLGTDGMFKTWLLSNNGYIDKAGWWFKNYSDAEQVKRNIQTHIKLMYGLDSA